MTDKRRDILKHLILLLVVVVPLFSLGISNHGLWSADEPRVAEIGREMAITGNWAVPMLNQKPFLEEPPLYYATLALTFKAFGVSDKVARIPSALFTLGSILVLFSVANMLFGPRVGFLSGLILATAGEFFRVGHWIVVDSALTFFIMSAMALFIAAYLSIENKRKLLYYALFYVSCTLAFYTKGFIGIVIPGLSILVFLAMEKNFKELLKMRLWLGVLIFIALTLPWFIALWHQAGTEHLKVFFLHNHLQRFLPASLAGQISEKASGHHHPFYYYATEFPGGFLPWSIFLIPVFYYAFLRRALSNQFAEKGVLFAKCWFFAGIIFLSVASTKRVLYLIPLFAPVSLLTALYIEATMAAEEVPHLLKQIGTIFSWVYGILLLVIGLGLTPAFLFLKKSYLLGGTGLTASVIAVSVILSGLSLAAVIYLQRTNLKKYWIAVNLGLISVFFFTLTVFVPILDTHKTFVPFSRQVQAIVPRDKPLLAYQPDETLRGAVPFYTGRYVTEIEELDNPILQKEDPLFLMIRDRKEELEKQLLTTGRLQVVVKQYMGTDRTLVLLSNRATEDPVIMGDPLKQNKREKQRGGTAP